MTQLSKVTRYRCKWCGKEFKTPDRHSCRWDPYAQNCLSCIHRGEFCRESVLDYHPETGVAVTLPAGFACSKEHDGDWSQFVIGKPGAASVNYEKHCPDYKTVPGWQGKKTYAEIERKRERSEIK